MRFWVSSFRTQFRFAKTGGVNEHQFFVSLIKTSNAAHTTHRILQKEFTSSSWEGAPGGCWATHHQRQWSHRQAAC